MAELSGYRRRLSNLAARQGHEEKLASLQTGSRISLFFIRVGFEHSQFLKMPSHNFH